MDGLVFRRAGLADLPLLIALRRTVLIAANNLPENTDLSAMDGAVQAYFSEYGHQTTVLCLAGQRAVGVGTVDYHTELPTFSNPTGRVAFLMNLYTAPEFRRRGIARHIVELLLSDAEARQAGAVLLEATEMGRPLYERMGFAAQGHMMRLENSNC